MKSKSFKTNVTNSSYLFDNLSDEWWNYNGYFKALHSFNLVRVDYIKRKTFNNSLNGLSVLDIGCGGGILCEPLSRLGALVTGIDSSERAIKVAKDHAKENNLKISYKHAELETIKNCDFDIITCMEVLEHVEDVNKIISISKKLLKKNGLFIGSTINKSFSSFVLALFVAENILKIIPKGTHEWKKLIKPNYLKKVFLRNDFHDFKIDGVRYNPFKNEWKYSNKTKINYMFSVIKF
tara:strand:+ start:172 stop:882 length:711 start_codon:yes stop_codon:yes gene_type:complete